ncbi:UNVERIFIED_CONTAM: hypothetical protein Sradi_1563900 [Sesamum radiatum]|uniref:Reverse transcriptase zinc-binding domain-containing protein n=1 Tax=Sesamum radiatum TaxID=300843 RepID=A0AAW2U9N7_SESRA
MNIVKSSFRWRISSGAAVRVWMDPWLPRPHTFLPITPRNTLAADVTVQTLINPTTNVWDTETIDAVFWPMDRDLILKIPLSKLGCDDLPVWHFSKDGRFSVKSAYCVARDIEEQRAPNTSFNSSKPKWGFLWSSPVPNKIKVFAWKLCKNAIPTSVNLAIRIQGTHFCCPLCQCSREDSDHAMITCPFARQVWCLSNLGWKFISTPDDTFEAKLRQLARIFSKYDFGLFLTTCWMIWWNRNCIFMENRTRDPDQVISHARHYFSAFLSQMNDLTNRTQTTAPCRWSPPPVNVVKINFDGALFVNEGESGIGVVARDSADTCLAWLSRRLPNCFSLELVEAMAAREALSMAHVSIGAV